jgi:hypothetical protein
VQLAVDTDSAVLVCSCTVVTFCIICACLIQRLIEHRSQVLSIPTAIRPELLAAVQAQATKHSASSDATQDSVYATATALATQVRLYQSYE